MRTTSCVVAVALLVVLVLATAAQADRPFAIRYTTNDAGSITFAANTLMTCPDSAPTCAAARAGTQGGTLGNNNGYAMTYVDVDGSPGTFDSSSADLTLPADATVLWAGLYWAGDTAAAPRGAPAPNPALNRVVSLQPPRAASYGTITADTLDTNTTRYSAFADVTDLVREAGGGTYTAANVQSGTGEDRYAAWDLIVVFRDTTQPPRNLTVFDGLATVSRATPVATASLSGFITPATGPVRTTVGLWSSEGDRTSTGDSATLNATPISDPSNPANNVFNSSISRFGVDVTDKNPNYVNQLGNDINLFREDGVLPNGATSATIRLTTGGETYYPAGVFFTTDIFAPDIRPVKSVVDVNGGATERGDELEYTVRLTNAGQDPAVALRFFDTVPAGSAYVPGSLAVTPATTSTGACGAFAPQTDAVDTGLAEFDPQAGRTVFRLGSGASDTAGGRLDPGQTACARFRVRVAPDAPRGSEIVNQGSANFIGATLGTQFPEELSNPVTNVVSGADLVPSKTHTGTFVAGQSNDFTIDVANAGNLASSGTVTVEDTFDPAQFSSVNSAAGDGWSCTTAVRTVTCTRTDAAPGGTSYPPITVNATVATPPPATVVNTATVSGGGDTDDSNNSATDAAGATAQADLAITKAADQETVPARGEVTFTLDVANRGPSAATAVSVADALAPNFAALDVTSSQGSCTDAVVCELGALARNGRATITIRARVLDAAVNSTVTNIATVTDTGASASADPEPDNDRADAVVDVPLSSDLRVAKSFAPSPNPTAGDEVTFTVVVGNDGPSTATNVITGDVLPAAYYDTTMPPTATVTGGGACTWLAAQRVVRCAVGTLIAGQQETITITTRLRPDSRGKTVLNSVGAISDSVDPNPGLATDTVSFVPIPAADLELTKTAPPDPVAPGGVARYIFRVANRGPSDAPDVVVRDTLPAGLTFLADTRGACSVAGQALTCRLGALASGATIDDLGVDVRVDPSEAGRTVRNAASVASEPSDPLLAPAETVPSSNEDAADLVVAPAVGVGPSPSPAPPVAPVAPVGPATKLDLALRVFAPTGPVRVGDRTRWRVKVVNNGPATATGVRVGARADGGTILAGARVAQAACDDGSPLACSLETLAPGASRTIALVVRPTRRGTLTLTGTVAGNEPETRSDNNRDRGSVGVKDAETKLALSETPRVRRVRGGRGLRIVVAVRNRGPHTARDLTVCQRLPSALRPVRLGAARRRDGVACWTVRSLGAGHSRRFVLTVRAAHVTRLVALTATVRAGNAPSRRASALVRIASPRRSPGFTG